MSEKIKDEAYITDQHVPISSDPSLEAHYIIETHTFRTFYYTDDEQEQPNVDTPTNMIQVHIKSAATTRGRSLIIPGTCDSTGIMIWPASYLLCQYLCYTQSIQKVDEINFFSLGSKILELGSGCGIVGCVAALTAKRFRPCRDTFLFYCTDMDDDVIQLCSENIRRNNLDTTSANDSNIHIAARTLLWGNKVNMISITDEAGIETFDSVIAADIVYPTTTDEILSLLFQTVNHMLKEGGIFLLSFVSRDGWKTPQRLIQAASLAKYKIEFIPYAEFIPVKWKQFLPPLLDARLLVLRRDERAENVNNQLGSDDCLIFPGLKRAMQSSSCGDDNCIVHEEWIAPDCFEE